MASKPPKRRSLRPAAKKTKKASQTKPQTKLDAIVTALRAPKGATLGQLIALTTWQPHSVRGALSTLKKQRSVNITSSKAGNERIYRIEASR